MSILVDIIPNTVNIDGIDYKINSNFRTSILFELLMQDKTIKEADMIPIALNLYYDIVPENIKEAIEKMLWFYRCGKDIEEQKETKSSKSIEQIYSFEYDDDYIFTAFLSQYGIDLQEIEFLHWWKFKAMFSSLNDTNKIVKIMEYRSTDLTKIKDKEQKEFYRNMKDLYKLPMNKEERDVVNKLQEALKNGEDITQYL
jgi:hypothetical protein